MLAALRVNSLINTIGPAPGQLLSSNNIHPPEAANMLAQQSYALHAEHAQVRCPFLRPNKHSRVGRQCAAVLSVNAAVQEQRSIASLSSLVHGSLTETAWGQTQKSTTFPKLSANAQADVLIIGAGITGLTAALQLLRSGKQVIVLEAKTVGAGGSGRHTGELTSWNRNHYSVLLSLYEKKTVVQIARSYLYAKQKLEEFLKEEKIDCEYSQLDGFVFSEANDASYAATAVQKEYNATRDANLTDISLVDDLHLGKEGVKLPKALQFSDSAVLNPVRYLDGLAEAVSRAGGQIFEQNRVQRSNSRNCTTQDGFKVTAREAVVNATGTPITHDLIDSSVRALAVHGKQVPRRRYAVAFTLPKDAGKEGVFYELSTPPRIVRISKTKGGSLQLLVSGEDHDQGIPAADYQDYFAGLEAWVRVRWPAVGQRTHQWSSQVFDTTEKLALHGKDPAPSPDTDFYISHGDGGDTLINATLGGLIISDDILSKENPFSELYSPSRTLRGAPANTPIPPVNLQYAENTIKAVVGQAIPQLSNPKLADLPTDSGAIVQKNINKLAVYKDEGGGIHAYSAVCPHLGCLLQWNPVEKQWNCPCHGSCFDKQGINMGGGPSTLDMGTMDGAL